MVKKQLISEVYRYPPIWDQRNKSHHNRYVLDKCWTDVAIKCGITDTQAKKTWKILRQQFKAHFYKLSTPESGDPAPEYAVEWPFFKSMLFLKDVFVKRPTSGNLIPDTKHEPESEVDYNSEADETQNTGGYILPSPVPSPHTTYIGHSSASTGTAPSPRPSSPASDDKEEQGYRKRARVSDTIAMGLLEIEREKMKLRKEKESFGLDKNDEDVAFFTSLLPHVKKLTPVQKMMFRIQIQQILTESVYGIKSEAGTVSMPPPSPQLSSSASVLQETVLVEGNNLYPECKLSFQEN